MMRRFSEKVFTSPRTGTHVRSLRQVEPVVQPESHLERFGGVENVCEFRRGGWRYSGDIGVGNVVIAAIQQIQEIGRNAPLLIKLISRAPY